MILSTQTFTHIPNNPIGVPVKRMLRPSIRTFFDHLLMTMHFAQGRPKPRVIPVRMKPMSFVKNSPYSAFVLPRLPRYGLNFGPLESLPVRALARLLEPPLLEYPLLQMMVFHQHLHSAPILIRPTSTYRLRLVAA